MQNLVCLFTGGLYSKLAGHWNDQKTNWIGEWILKTLKIPVVEYRKTAEYFNPVKFDAKEWVKLAIDTGMKYIVVTAKHHDGFAMYHSKCSKYNIVDATPFRRDPISELASECKTQGIKLCFYYSQTQDWDEPNGYGYGPDPNKQDKDKDFRQYFEDKCKPQIRELLTEYGDIGIMWFDTPFTMAEEFSRELYDLVKRLQPNCIVSGRIGNQYGEYMTTGDNMIPSLPYDGDWEVPATLNDTWGYKTDDHNWKSPKKLINLFAKVNSRGGNYLLNIGPDEFGVIPEASVKMLNRVGQWVKENSESVFGTKAMPVTPYETEWGIFTHKDGKIYMHVFDWDLFAHEKKIIIHCFANTIKKAYLLKTGEPVQFHCSYSPASKDHHVIIFAPEQRPDDIDSVICIETEENEVLFDSLGNL